MSRHSGQPRSPRQQRKYDQRNGITPDTQGALPEQGKKISRLKKTVGAAAMAGSVVFGVLAGNAAMNEQGINTNLQSNSATGQEQGNDNIAVAEDGVLAASLLTAGALIFRSGRRIRGATRTTAAQAGRPDAHIPASAATPVTVPPAPTFAPTVGQQAPQPQTQVLPPQPSQQAPQPGFGPAQYPQQQYPQQYPQAQPGYNPYQQPGYGAPQQQYPQQYQQAPQPQAPNFDPNLPGGPMQQRDPNGYYPGQSPDEQFGTYPQVDPSQVVGYGNGNGSYYDANLQAQQPAQPPYIPPTGHNQNF